MLFLCLASVNISAQPEFQFNTEREVNHYYLNDGLPNEVIHSIIKRRNGEIWFTTVYHLVKYDGYSFTVYEPPNYVYFGAGDEMYEDDKGYLWMRYHNFKERRLLRFDPITAEFKEFGIEDSDFAYGDGGYTRISKDQFLVGTKHNMVTTKYDENNQFHLTIHKDSFPEELNQYLERIHKQEPSVSLIKLGNNVDTFKTIVVTEESQFLVVGLGEIYCEVPALMEVSPGGSADYGWLEDDRGDTLWQMSYEKSYYTHNREGNRLCAEIVTLSPGEYKIKYISDESHSYDNWYPSESKPILDSKWGIELYAISNDEIYEFERISGSLKNRLSDLVRKKPWRTIHIDSNGNYWACHKEGLFRYKIEGDAILSQEKISDENRYSMILGEGTEVLVMMKINYHSGQEKFYSIDVINKSNGEKIREIALGVFRKPGRVVQQFLHFETSSIDDFINGNTSGFINESIYCRSLYELKVVDDTIYRNRIALPVNEGNEYIDVMDTQLDNEGNLWVGSRRHGLYKIKLKEEPFQYHQIPGDDNKDENDIIEIVNDSDKNYWVTTKKGVWRYKIDEKKWKEFHAGLFSIQEILPHQSKIIGTSDGNILLQLKQTVYEYNREKEAFEIVNINVEPGILLAFEDDTGRIWAHNYREQKFFIYRNNTFKELNHNRPMSSAVASFNVYGDYLIKHNQHVGILLFKISPSEDSLEFIGNKILEPIGIMAQEVESFSENELVISTFGSGLILYDIKTDSTRQIKIDQSGYSNDIVKSFYLSDSTLLVFTSNGAGRLNTNNGSFYPIKAYDKIYDQNDWNKNNYSDYFNMWSRSFVNGRDQIVFKGGAGFYELSDNNSDTLVEVFINNIDYENKNHNNRDTSSLRLKHFQNNVTITYTGLLYNYADAIGYKYYLDGQSDDWVYVGNERTVRFTDLSPGNYHFKVTAHNQDGVWTDRVASISFTILPAWYWNSWTKILYLLLLLIGTYLIYKFLLERKLKLQEIENFREMDNLKNRLYTNITHEFRTPLTVIGGMASSINEELNENERERFQERLGSIERNKDNLLNLVNQMLDLSKIEHGKMKQNPIQSDIVPFLKYIFESYHSMAQRKSIEYVFYCEEDEIIMDYDPDALFKVVSNLLTNAIKFTSDKGKIIVHSRKDGDNFIFKVKDNGIGIQKEDIPLIFDRFYQVDETMTKKEEGTGIGLSLCKELLILMKGEIDVSSKPGEGSTFLMSIPISHTAGLQSSKNQLTEKPKATIAEESVKEESFIQEGGDLPMVLIIEDNQDVAKFIRLCLKKDFSTVWSENGKLGLERAIELIPDLIISDIMMPELDGYELCKAIKSEEKTSHIPVILLTAKATVSDKIEGLSVGADAYLYKPFEKEELIVRAHQMIKLRQKLREKYSKTNIWSDQYIPDGNNIEDAFIHKAKTIIENHIDDTDFGPVQLARGLYLSESQVYRKLKALTGKSTALFIRSARLHKSLYYLKAGDYSITEIAYKVGFNDIAWYSKAFKQEFGVSPSEISK